METSYYFIKINKTLKWKKNRILRDVYYSNITEPKDADDQNALRLLVNVCK